MVSTDAAKYDGCKALGFVLIGPAVFICMFNSWFCCIVVNCQFNLVSYLALKISLSFGGTVGIPLDATCCGDSETLVFALIRWLDGWWEIIKLLFRWSIDPMIDCKSFIFHLFVAFHGTNKSGYFCQIQNALFRLDWLARWALVYGQVACLTDNLVLANFYQRSNHVSGLEIVYGKVDMHRKVHLA